MGSWPDTDLFCPLSINTRNIYIQCFLLSWTSVRANQLNYCSTTATAHSCKPRETGRHKAGARRVSVNNLAFLHSNYWGNNQWKTDGRSYRHFRSRNGVIFLNGNSWPPLKSFIICFRICTKSLEI